MEELNKARRINQAYEDTYGPELMLNAPSTRDLAANKVIERRSWFPAITTAAWFTSPMYMTQHENMKLTRGIDLNNRETFRARARPGQIAYQSSFGTTNTLELDESDTTNTWLYIVGIVLAIVIISMLF